MTNDVTLEDQQPARGWLDYLILAAKGFAMGCADVVPGVSGGTMAFILGIYEELIGSIQMLSMPDTLKKLFSFDIQWAFSQLPWRFLLAVAVGILTAVFSMAKVLEWALHTHPVYLWAFFFGLVVASIIVVRNRVANWNVLTVIGVVVGAVVAFLVVTLVPLETPNTPLYLFGSGVIAICAMILPGISGSFLLVIMGKYQQILAAVNDWDFLTLLWFGLGAGIGIVTFAQVVGWLFKKYHDLTISVLIGLMVGSLWKIWPWKEVRKTYTKPDGEVIPLVEWNNLPALDEQLFFALLFGLIGFLLVFGLERLALINDGDDGAE